MCGGGKTVAMVNARCRQVSPGGGEGPGGAIAVIQVTGDVDGALRALSIKPVGVGEARLRWLAGVDEGIVARVAEGVVLLMPHAGAAVAKGLADAFARAGIAHGEVDDPRRLYPEAASLLEARMLCALSMAASPLAVDLLLDQPRRWAESGVSEDDPAVLERSRVLNRLIDPPLVVAVGPANIGKSTLLNALAGSAVALVADEPGTTRDHVGVTLDAGGLVVRYVDTPGVRGEQENVGEIEREASAIAAAMVERADLVLLCADPRVGGFPESAVAAGQGVLRICLRCDLGPAPEGTEVAVCAPRGEGLEELVEAIRERLVPCGVLEDPGPWRFWG